MRVPSRIGASAWVGLFLAAVVLVAAQPSWSASSKGRDLVVVDHERWLDTLKGTIKNFSKKSARDVTVIVKFFDKKRKPLGTQRVSVGDLHSGDQASWSLPIDEKNRPAARYEFEMHAIWP